MTDAQPCPSCRSPMDTRRFERQVYGEVALDICWDCHAIWFDQYESAQLSPGAVIALFRLIHEHRSDSMRPLADFMGCPRCKAKLVLTQDVQRTNRLSYYRCTAGHGRLTTFVQFLREKQFVRSLSKPEIEQLKARVSQVRCSSCGAAVSLSRDAVCPYCRSPISVLDGAAVEKTLASLREAERRRTSPNAAEMAAAFGSLVATHRDARHESPWLRDISPSQSSPVLVDLVLQGIGSLFER